VKWGKAVHSFTQLVTHIASLIIASLFFSVIAVS